MMAKPAITAAAAGLGRPLKYRCSSSSLVSTLNRASRSAAQAANAAAMIHTACLCNQRELRTHLHQQKARRHAKADHVAEAVQLRPEIAGRAGQPGHVAVQPVEHHRQENQPARSASRRSASSDHVRPLRLSAHRLLDPRRHHDGKEPANQVPQRQQRRERRRSCGWDAWEGLRDWGLGIRGQLSRLRFRKSYRHAMTVVPSLDLLANFHFDAHVLRIGQDQFRARAELDHAELLPPPQRLRPAAGRRRSAGRWPRKSAAPPAAGAAAIPLPGRSTCFRSASRFPACRALRNSPGEYRRAITRDSARGTVQVYVENRQEDADPHGRAADELVVLQPGDLDHFAVGRRDQQARPRGHPPRRIAEEIDDQTQTRRRQRRQVPDRTRPPEPSAPTSGQPISCSSARPQRANGSRPRQRNGSSAASQWQEQTIAAVLQVAGVEDFVRGAPAGRPARTCGHPADVAGAKMLEPPPPPAAPGQIRSDSRPHPPAAR